MVRDSCLMRFKYDASGRSTGRASVWYENEADAHTAHNEFDGAQAKGETIIVTVGDTRPLPDSRGAQHQHCLLYTSPSPRDLSTSRMPSSA